jgi:LPXTG-motif cell wall-anchored protein
VSPKGTKPYVILSAAAAGLAALVAAFTFFKRRKRA